MIQLIVKGDADYAHAAAGNHNISLDSVVDVGNNTVVAYSNDASEYDVVRWFCETDARDCRPGFGYSPGTLLHYTFRN